MNREEVLEKANELISDKNFEEAKELLDSYTKENDDNTLDIQKTLGLCNVNLDKYSEAKENFEKVVAINDEDATAWFYLGMIYEEVSSSFGCNG